VQHTSDALTGFIGAFPFQAEPFEIAATLKRAPRAWGAYCAGALGLGRQEAANTANSEIFFMRAPSRRLDHDYTMIGMTVFGLEVIRALAVGEPPATPDIMQRARVMADVAPQERRSLQIMDSHASAFDSLVSKVRVKKASAFSICDLQIPVRRIEK
jgi:peptidylprolyl isomerase